MTPFAAVLQAEAVDTVAGARVWGRQLATVRAYYGDDWFAGRSVLSLARDVDMRELASLGARCVTLPTGFNPDQEWTCGQVDLVLHLGVLSHLDASHASLRHACAYAGNVVIETPVCDSHDHNLLVCIERTPPSSADPSSPEPRVPSPESGPEPSASLLRSYGAQADVRPGTYPSPARIEQLLVEHGMLFQRLADSRCNGPEQIYDWLAMGNGRVTPGHRRLWFARKG